MGKFILGSVLGRTKSGNYKFSEGDDLTTRAACMQVGNFKRNFKITANMLANIIVGVDLVSRQPVCHIVWHGSRLFGDNNATLAAGRRRRNSDAIAGFLVRFDYSNSKSHRRAVVGLLIR